MTYYPGKLYYKAFLVYCVVFEASVKALSLETLYFKLLMKSASCLEFFKVSSYTNKHPLIKTNIPTHTYKYPRMKKPTTTKIVKYPHRHTHTNTHTDIPT